MNQLIELYKGNIKSLNLFCDINKCGIYEMTAEECVKFVNDLYQEENMFGFRSIHEFIDDIDQGWGDRWVRLSKSLEIWLENKEPICEAYTYLV